ncbi:MAG: 16S rRNA (guanine(527)-N(7))-methyltransferase RsmG [Eubacteriales bacterium]|nr:16S rRNA (guanine(527)-N(7))-methyltransferase RsmG [Eubacteriales bacterium]
MTFEEKLYKEAKSVGAGLDGTALCRFATYYNMLITYNTHMNLTAITEEDEVIVKHFADSLCILGKIQVKEGAKVLDVGTGAGFPGIPLLIARPDLKLTLLDGLNKRLVFLSDVLEKLSLEAEIVHSRAEESGHNPKYREKFDLVTSRAVARQSVLCEYCLPYTKKGGLFVAMKGPKGQEELSESEKGIKLLGGEIREVAEYTLSDESARTLIITEKVSPTPGKYPRHNSQIKSKPL